ncbi:MAG TPA: class A beta-lactamase-related serine hydrolase [Armatimonadetes bacterium]|nr:class A beta-lactamase-related serine hydrolase [Armatimonadota bacterium]
MTYEEAFQPLEEEIAAGRIPGAVAVVLRAGEMVWQTAAGWAQVLPARRPMKYDTIFDLASVTKVVATTTAVMHLYQAGRLALDAPVAEYLPEFHSVPTVRHLLTHTSGLPAWKPFYREHSSPEAIFAAVCATPLEHKPGTKCTYSDLGFITLGVLVERVSGEPLNVYCHRHLFAPLGLSDTGFNPPPDKRSRCAATEECPWRGRILCGEVHDENAYACGGVAGHAGLFSTASDLAVFLHSLLESLAPPAAGRQTAEVLSPATVRPMFAEQTGPAEERFWLGWKRLGYGEGGPQSSPLSFGHDGFTGTLLWADPERELGVILLTNRVHPRRENRRLYEVRPQFLSRVLRVVEGENCPSVNPFPAAEGRLPRPFRG